MPKLPSDIALSCLEISAESPPKEALDRMQARLHKWALELMKWGSAVSICSKHQYGEDPSCKLCYPKTVVDECEFCTKQHDLSLACPEYMERINKLIEQSMVHKADLHRYMKGGATGLTTDRCVHGDKVRQCIEEGCAHYDPDAAWRRSHGGHGRTCDCDTCRYNQW